MSRTRRGPGRKGCKRRRGRFPPRPGGTPRAQGPEGPEHEGSRPPKGGHGREETGDGDPDGRPSPSGPDAPEGASRGRAWHGVPPVPEIPPPRSLGPSPWRVLRDPRRVLRDPSLKAPTGPRGGEARRPQGRPRVLGSLGTRRVPWDSQRTRDGGEGVWDGPRRIRARDGTQGTRGESLGTRDGEGGTRGRMGRRARVPWGARPGVGPSGGAPMSPASSVDPPNPPVRPLVNLKHAPEGPSPPGRRRPWRPVRRLARRAAGP